MNVLISALAAFLFSAWLLGASALAADFENDKGISKEKLVESLAKNTNLNTTQIEGLVQALQQQFSVKPDQQIPIRGYLYSSGMNWALLFDHDTWYFDATIKDPATGELVHIPKLFLCDFHNGGLKFEVAYKWMFTFIPAGASVFELQGGQYGRGIGVVADAFLGLEGSWMPAQNRNHDIFHAALKVDFGGGIVFPKMEFKLRQINMDTKTAALLR